MEPAHRYKAIVKGVDVYGGDDEETAMLFFENAVDAAGIAAEAEMVMFILGGVEAFQPTHFVVDGRPVIEAHMLMPDGEGAFVGALYGIEYGRWMLRNPTGGRTTQ